jgi:hypothetical protein
LESVVLPSTEPLTFADNIPASASYAYQASVSLLMLPVVAITRLTHMPADNKVAPSVLSVKFAASLGSKPDESLNVNVLVLNPSGGVGELA